MGVPVTYGATAKGVFAVLAFGLLPLANAGLVPTDSFSAESAPKRVVAPKVDTLRMAETASEPFTNPFAATSVASPAALAKYLEEDAQAMDRFVRHFGMSREAVLDFVHSLRLGALPKGGTYTIYCAQRQEGAADRIFTTSLRLNEGTPVFLDRDGQPALLALCANPIANDRAVMMAEPVGDPSRALGLIQPVSALGALAGLGTLLSPGDSNSVQPVPEPATFLALGLGAACLARRRRARRGG